MAKFLIMLKTVFSSLILTSSVNDFFLFVITSVSECVLSSLFARYTYPEKNNLNWSGSMFQFLWHFLSITARVIALSLFASVFPLWIGPVCAAHWLIMSSWLIFQRTHACHTRCEEILFCLVLVRNRVRLKRVVLVWSMTLRPVMVV